jgi:hypothetical protein
MLWRRIGGCALPTNFAHCCFRLLRNRGGKRGPSLSAQPCRMLQIIQVHILNTKRGTRKPPFEPSFIFVLVRLAGTLSANCGKPSHSGHCSRSNAMKSILIVWKRFPFCHYHFLRKLREKYLRKRQTLAQSTSNQNANQQPRTHSSLLYPHLTIANFSSLGLLQIEQGLNRHAPLCFLENQSHDKYGTNLPTN